jgi:hypothetical protein
VHGEGGTVVLDYWECACYEYAGVCSCGGIKNGSLLYFSKYECVHFRSTVFSRCSLLLVILSTVSYRGTKVRTSELIVSQEARN